MSDDIDLPADDYPWEFTLSDLRATGLLWLINTSVFHPRGLAMSGQ